MNTRDTIGARLLTLARSSPSRIAMSEGEARISFSELDATAAAIAARIVAAAGERDGTVCLLFEDRIAAVQAIFGAGRSGRPYVPLDARDPDERLRFIIEDCRPVAIVTEPSLLGRARGLAREGCTILADGVAGVPSTAIGLPQVSPDAIAYLFYTSGSTGRPKGVSQTHRNLLFFADAYAAALRISDQDRLSLLYSLSFSAANMDIFGGMLSGGTLVGYDMRRDGVPLLADWLEREQITVLHAVPTVFRELLTSLAPGRKLSHLRAIDLGGESVFGSDVELFRRHTNAGCILVNHLAATEASVIAQHAVGHDADLVTGILPVGRPPAGLRVTIRREDGTAADAGEAGEIVVSSAHVSPGYWQRPELNAAAFAPDPLEPGSRRYFTGDLGRLDVGGNLHFLGRSGNRIKIRGFTVDLAEVEAAVASCTGVVKSAVLAEQRGSSPEPDRLVAYVVGGPELSSDQGGLRRLLSTRLPPYMLPSRVVMVESLPITATGKVDRKALEAAARAAMEQRVIDPPRNDAERIVARLFEALLELPAVGRDDDFFLLGGDSLSVVELQTRLRDAFGIGLQGIQEDATVAGIAAQITSAGARPAARSVPILTALRAGGGELPLFLVHGRLGQALVSPHLLRLLGSEQPVWAFQGRGLDGLREPYATIEEMASEYVEEMRALRPHGPYFVGALCAGALVAMAMARSLREAGETVLPLLLLDPPEQSFAMAEQGLSERKLLGRLRKRQAMGRIDAPIDNPVYAQASVRVAQAFEQAIRRYHPSPYDGPVFMLSSSTRIGADPAALRRLYAGRVERFEVASTHSEILDSHNPLFATHLAYCLGRIRDAARAIQPRAATH
ncbi:MAG TPA: AMP-binding protein [Casimicrobiaceae bacterium]